MFTTFTNCTKSKSEFLLLADPLLRKSRGRRKTMRKSRRKMRKRMSRRMMRNLSPPGCACSYVTMGTSFLAREGLCRQMVRSGVSGRK